MTKIHKVKTQLFGSNFTKLMLKKKTNKYRIVQDIKISYQTLYNWETERVWPKDETAMKVGKYLGLLLDNNRILELEKKADEIKTELERLK